MRWQDNTRESRQKIGVLLKDDLSKDSLIEKLYEILADLVKPIQIGR